ncbi:MAG: Protein GrpE [Phycisphaerae bacterium]|nr:Protein GrpE [Phycisphaerae bacterium]
MSNEESTINSNHGNSPPEENVAGELETETAVPHAGSSEAVDWKDKYLRAKADFANYQRRTADEQQLAVRFANAGLAKNLLDILDDLERLLAASKASTVIDPIPAVQLINDKLLKMLRDQQVEPVPSQGQPFDPHCHEALLQQSSDTAPPGTVLQELRKGYRMRDRVLRPAQVIVAATPVAAPANAADAPTTEEK